MSAADLREAERFLSILDPEAEAFCFRTFAEAGKGIGKKYSGALDQVADALATDNAKGYGIFVVVNEGGQKAAEIQRVRAVFADFDPPSTAPMPERFALEPHLVIESSPGKHHCYWLVDGLPPAEFKAAQQAIIACCGSDPQPCDLPRVMRLPGFFHRKGEAFMSRIVLAEDAAQPYTADQIRQAFAQWHKQATEASKMHVAAVVETDRHGDVLAISRRLAGMVVRDGMSREAAMTALQAEVARGRYTRGIPSDELARALDGSIAWHRQNAQPAIEVCDEPAQKAYDDRHRVIVRRGRIADAVDSAEQGMLASGAALYARGDVLVRLAVGVKDKTVRRAHRAPVLTPATPPMILEEMERACRFVAQSVNEETGAVTTRTVGCPPSAPSVYLGRVGSWQVPNVVGIAETPIQREDGTLLANGWEDGILVIAPGDWPTIPKAPTQDDALAAIGALRELVARYDFVSDVDESVTLAAFLTAVARPSLRSAPAFGWSAPVRGSGKSKLADVTAILATGRPAAALAWPVLEEEAEKRVGAAVIAGDPVLLIDNIEVPVKSQVLNSLLTQESIAVRILGKSSLQRMASRALLLLTGNNLQIAGDLTRRVLVAEIDPSVERPELRRFDFEPVHRARSRRRDLVAACLTVLRWGQSIGSQVAPLGSFEDWSRAVRDPLIALGLPDPCQCLTRLVEDDPERSSALGLLSAIHNTFGPGASVTASQIIQRAEAIRARDPMLFEAVEMVARDRGGRVVPIRLSAYLRKHKSQVIGGLVLRQAEDTHRKTALWRVELHRNLRVAA